MSIFSEYKNGSMSEEEFESACAVMNRIDREERRMMDGWDLMEEETEDEEDEE